MIKEEQHTRYNGVEVMLLTLLDQVATMEKDMHQSMVVFGMESEKKMKWMRRSIFYVS